MKHDRNCPNCAAPIVGPVCEYCGTTFPWYRSSAEYELLKAKTCVIQEQDIVKTLYNEAIFAMRAYGSGLITYNEAREMVGFDPI